MTALVLGHKNPDTDSIVSALSATNLYRGRGLDVEPGAQGKPAPETEFVLSRFNLQAPPEIHEVAGRDLYLVDYSDLAQAPDDFAKAKLLGIIDHHKLGDVTSDSPVECYIQPVGCSNTVIKRLHDYYGVEIPKNLAGAMLCAILSDTVLFKSPTCTSFDTEAAFDLAKIAGVDDVQALGMEMFKAKSNLNASPRDLIFRDFKDFNMSGHKIGIGQLELISLSMVTPDLMSSLKSELAKVKSEGRDSALLVITDIMEEGSQLLLCSDQENTIAKALNATVADKIWLPGVMSRKKQVVPQLEQAFKG